MGHLSEGSWNVSFVARCLAIMILAAFKVVKFLHHFMEDWHDEEDVENVFCIWGYSDFRR